MTLISYFAHLLSNPVLYVLVMVFLIVLPASYTFFVKKKKQTFLRGISLFLIAMGIIQILVYPIGILGCQALPNSVFANDAFLCGLLPFLLSIAAFVIVFVLSLIAYIAILIDVSNSPSKGGLDG